MNTIQDKSKASMGKVQDIVDDTRSVHKNECLCESVVKPTPTNSRAECVLDKTTNLLEAAYDEWLANAVELDRLQTLIQKAHKKNYKLQTLIQKTHKVRYAAMKRDHDSELKRVQTKYNAYDTSGNKVRRTGNTEEPETANKAYQTTLRRYSVPVAVISSDSEDDSSEDSDSSSKSGNITV